MADHDDHPVGCARHRRGLARGQRGRGVDEHEVVAPAHLAEQLVHPAGAEHVARLHLVGRLPAGEHVEGAADGPHGPGHADHPVEHLDDPGAAQVEQCRQRLVAQVGVHQQHPLPDRGRGEPDVRRGDRAPLTRNGAGHHDHGTERRLGAVQVHPDPAVGLRRGSARRRAQRQRGRRERRIEPDGAELRSADDLRDDHGRPHPGVDDIAQEGCARGGEEPDQHPERDDHRHVRTLSPHRRRGGLHHLRRDHRRRGPAGPRLELAEQPVERHCDRVRDVGGQLRRGIPHGRHHQQRVGDVGRAHPRHELAGAFVEPEPRHDVGGDPLGDDQVGVGAEPLGGEQPVHLGDLRPVALRGDVHGDLGGVLARAQHGHADGDPDRHQESGDGERPTMPEHTHVVTERHLGISRSPQAARARLVGRNRGHDLDRYSDQVARDCGG